MKPRREELLDGHHPSPPERWRDLFDADYHYPEHMSGWRGTRARRAWRTEDRRARRQWLKQQEARPGPAGIPGSLLAGAGLLLLLVALLVTLDDLRDSGNRVESSPSAARGDDPDPAGGTAADTGPPGEPPTAPVADAAPVRGAAPAAVIATWAEVFYTRDPAGSGESYDRLLDRAAPWMTDQLTANLATVGDPTYEELGRAGTASRVDAVTVTRPQAGVRQPADTPIRVTRVATVTVALTDGETFDVPLLVELIRDETGWLVASLAGDAHDH